MIVAGFGFRSGATVESLNDAYDRARLGREADVLATVDDKLTLVAALGQSMRRPAVGVAARFLEAQETETVSEAVLQARGVGSVAEAAALAAAGPGARLMCLRVVSEDGRATCALAFGEDE
ncbi:cobalamin biosynthesis protein [Sagittula salina]|uniref:Cobalamin biosynthesis protein n=1 Tax=Sagittula salina TaxID=2820268 RepID=A0A940S3A8_9RHOB|nr:cobalamin biosynthesis protein [Sagittula salina]MBP0484896.1 cobalamin biosynthesis protein [Sagittula salina]